MREYIAWVQIKENDEGDYIHNEKTVTINQT